MRSLSEFLNESRNLISSKSNIDFNTIKSVATNFESDEQINELLKKIKDEEEKDDAIADLFVDTLEAIRDNSVNHKEALKLFKSIGFEKVPKTKFLEITQRKSHEETMSLVIFKDNTYMFVFNSNNEFADNSIYIGVNGVKISDWNRLFKVDFNDKAKYNKWLEGVSGLYIAKNSRVIRYSVAEFMESSKN